MNTHSWDDLSAFPVSGRLISYFLFLTLLRKDAGGTEHPQTFSPMPWALSEATPFAFHFPYPELSYSNNYPCVVSNFTLRQIDPFAFCKSNLFHHYFPTLQYHPFLYTQLEMSKPNLCFESSDHHTTFLLQGFGVYICFVLNNFWVLASEEFLAPNLTSLLKTPLPLYTRLAQVAIPACLFSFPEVTKNSGCCVYHLFTENLRHPQICTANTNRSTQKKLVCTKIIFFSFSQIFFWTRYFKDSSWAEYK